MEMIKDREDKLKDEFMKKSSKEKYEFLYNEINDLKEELENKECDHCCDADNNSDWIEKIKFEQNIFDDRLNNFYDDLADLEEKVNKIYELLGLDKIEEMEKKIEYLERERKTRKFFAEKDPEKQRKIFLNEE